MTSPEESFKKFQAFDFQNDSEWQQYLKNIYPTPTIAQLQKIKRKWYQKNIDSNFVLDYGASSSSEANDSKSREAQGDSSNSSHSHSEHKDSHDHHQHHFHQAPPSGPVQPPGLLTRALFNIEGYLKGCFMTSIFGFQSLSTTIAVIVCILALIRQGKRPRFDKVYARKIVFNEYFHDLLYLTPFYFFPNQRTIFYYLPLVVHFWIGLCEFLRFKGGRFYEAFKRYADLTHNNKVALMTQKSKIEIYILVFLVILFLMGKSAILMLVFYANFLRIKYIISDNCKMAFRDINGWIEPRCQGFLPFRFFYGKIKQICAWMVKVKMPENSQQAR